MMTAPLPEENRYQALRLMLYLAIASMIMLFAALTSALLVSKGKGDWQLFTLPPIFWVNTLVILLSSGSMYLAVRSYRALQYKPYLNWLLATTLLGSAFLIGQLLGWQQLTAGGIRLSGNVSGSYLYVISGAHAVHVAGGVVMLLISLLRSWRRPLNPARLGGLQLLATYWHFVDLLWLYLMMFLYFNVS
ncbi:MAG: heme-copper oxidase subunit III [Chitinophagales bacterium]|nr:heme-copper oxidase subunit III [Chitinophagales bacterium]MDW8393055.1 heme-copper oxidase subunit III [Chitinophagales bacterium]